MPITFWAKVFFLEPYFESGARLGWLLGWAGLGWGWPAQLTAQPTPRSSSPAPAPGNLETEIGVFVNETEIGLFENGKVCLHSKNELPDGQQQQAISIYFFLEGLGFRV